MAIGMTEILVIAAVAIFLFGGKKVIDWARSMGRVKKEFEKASKEEDTEEGIEVKKKKKKKRSK